MTGVQTCALPISAFPPTILPVEGNLDVGFGSDLLHTYVGADRDLILSDETAEEIAAYYEAASAEYHHIGMIGTYPSSSEPDSILPVLNGRVDSEGGSENTTNLGGSDSDESDFESKVQNAFAPSKEVMMTQPAVPPKDDDTRQEKDDFPPVAGDAKATAPKEAADAEVKANEAPDAKKALEQEDAEKKKIKAAKKAARDAANPPKTFDKGEPSARPSIKDGQG